MIAEIKSEDRRVVVILENRERRIEKKNRAYMATPILRKTPTG